MNDSLPERWPLPETREFPGRFLTLRPLVPARDAEELYGLSHGEEVRGIWTYLPRGPFRGAEEMRVHLEEWQAQPGTVQFLAKDNATGAAIGSISLMRITREHGVAELGYIWFVPTAQRTKANTEANYLLLRHCFDDLGYRRMEWKCDDRNEPSRRAALRLGFQYEGKFRQHMVVRGGNRDTDWFSMLDQEWPQRKAAMERWLYGDDSVSLRELNARP